MPNLASVTINSDRPTVRHLMIYAEVDIGEDRVVNFWCEVENYGGHYRSRNIRPTWGKPCATVQEAVEDEADRVYRSLTRQPPQEEPAARPH